jgi:hypothetical protein
MENRPLTRFHQKDVSLDGAHDNTRVLLETEDLRPPFRGTERDFYFRLATLDRGVLSPTMPRGVRYGKVIGKYGRRGIEIGVPERETRNASD